MSCDGEKRGQLLARLGRIKEVIGRIEQLEARAAAAAAAAAAAVVEEEEEEGRDESGNASEEGKGDAFTKERSAVGARMTVASSSSKQDEQKLAYDEQDVEDEEQDGEEQVEGVVEQGGEHLVEVEDEQEEDMMQELKDGEVSSEFSKEVWNSCTEILTTLGKSEKEAWVFSQPVQVLWPDLVNYDKIIKKPMDLGTVRKRIDMKLYRTPEDYARDVRLTFHNSMQFNMAGSLYHNLAKRLLMKFDRSFKAMEKRIMQRSVGTSATVTAATAAVAASNLEPGPRTPPLFKSEEEQRPLEKSVPPPAAAIPVDALEPLEATARLQADTSPVSTLERDVEIPRIQGLNPRLGRQNNSQAYGGLRELKPKEKDRLSELIESLPGDRLSKVFEILQGKCPSALRLKGDGDMELDLEVLDTATQFEIFRLAMNWQKSKRKRRKGGGEHPLEGSSLKPCSNSLEREEIAVGNFSSSSISKPGSSQKKKSSSNEDDKELVSSSSDSGNLSSSNSSSSGSSSSGSESESESENEQQTQQQPCKL